MYWKWTTTISMLLDIVCTEESSQNVVHMYVEYLHITLVNCFPRKWITRRRGIWGVQKINRSFTIIFLLLKACCWASCFFTNFSFIHASRSVWSLEYKLNSFVIIKYCKWSYSLTRTQFLVRGVVTWKILKIL